MKVLIACEFSGVVRDAFIEQGHDAISCDLLPTESPGPHYHGDVIDFLGAHAVDFDLMIAHPPCQFLSNSGVRWLYKGGRKENGPDPLRWRSMGAARDFFMYLLNQPIPRIAVENPVPHGHAFLPPFTQTFQPWEFGHGEIKRTCLWLKNLPPLKPTTIVEGRDPRVHHASPSPDRWKERSITLPGIAKAMASQWSNLGELDNE